MAERKVVVRQEERKRKLAQPWGEGVAFKVGGWVGFAFVMVALGDFALALYPFGLGSPEWEVGTIGSIVQGFPLLTLGLVGIWVCGGGLGDRRLLVTVAVVFWVIAFALALMLLLILTDVPIALQATREAEAARLGIVKLVAKTVYLGLVFGALYVVAGVLALRQARGGTST